jgi:hypothetical protein
VAEQRSPYAAPSALVEDIHADQERGEFIRDGQVVPAGHGWEWWRSGFGIFRTSPWMWVLVMIVLIGLFLLAGGLVFMIAISMMRTSPAGFMLVIGLIGLALTIVYPIFVGGIMLGARAADEGEGLGVGHVFAGFGHSSGRLATVGLAMLVGNFVIQVLVTLLFGAWLRTGAMSTNPAMMLQQGALVFLVYLALTLPLAMGFWFAPALVVFNDSPAVDAIRSSFLGCLKNVVPFLIYGLVALGLGIVVTVFVGILAGLTRGVGILLLLALPLALGPIVIGSIYASYRDIYTQH